MNKIQDYDVSNPFSGKVLSTSRLTSSENNVEICEIVIEIQDTTFSFKSGQSIGVIAPGDPAFGNNSIFRLYTIAGTGETDNTIKICVKRCFYVDFINGERYKGTVSNYLCDLVGGDTVSLAGPYGMAFTLPKDKTSDLLMIGLGTGIAPFRALVKHIYENLGGWEGKVRLFYGAKTGLDMAYMNDEKNDFSLYYDEATFKAIEAVSPRPAFNKPVALDEALTNNSDEVWSMISEPNTHVFIAGLKQIRELTDKAFVEMADSPEKWDWQLKALKSTGRWQEVIY